MVQKVRLDGTGGHDAPPQRTLSIQEAAEISITSGTPTILWGAPGTAKTSWLIQLTERAGAHLEVITLASREPADVNGHPALSVDRKEVNLVPPGWATRLYDALKKGQKACLFLDEMNLAGPAIQAAALRIMQEKRVSDNFSLDGIWIAAAANPPKQAAGGWDLPGPTANRLVHIDWSLDYMTWAAWMLARGPGLAKFRGLVTAFVKQSPGARLLHVPDSLTNAGKAWPSPRSWTNAATLLSRAEERRSGDDIKQILVAGCVGDMLAIEFLSWLRDLDLPDPEVLLRDPDKWAAPKARADKILATLSAVVAAISERPTLERWNAGWSLISIAEQAGHGDVAAISAPPLANMLSTKVELRGQRIPEELTERLEKLLRSAGICR